MADETKARGNAAFSTGNFTEAVTHFTDAINLSPNNHLLYSNRSAAHASLSNFTQALTDAQKTVELKPDWSKGYSRLGAAYTGLKNYSEAASSYKKGLEIDPSNHVLKSGLTEANYALANAAMSHKQLELKNAFNATKSTEELLKTFQEMEDCYDKVLLVVECTALVKALQGVHRHEDADLFLQKVNKLLLGDDDKSCPDCSLADNSMFSNAKSLNTMGSVCLDQKDYVASFKYLGLANLVLTRLEQDETCRCCCAGNCLLRAIEFNQYRLHRACLFTNKLEEAVVYGKKHLEVKEKLVGGDCIELALANMDVFFTYGGLMKFTEAIPYGLKAVEIQTKCLGSESVEVANMRFNLSFMYHQLGEHDKALELEELSDKVLNEKTRDSPDVLIKAGRYEEAISVLEGEVSSADIEESERALDFLCMGNACLKLGRIPDAKKHLRTAEEMLKNLPGLWNPCMVAASLLGVSEMYEEMDDTEAAVSLIKRVLAIPDLPPKLLSQAASSLFLLVPKSGKAREEILDMLDTVEKLKVTFGLEHCEVGYGCGHLGVAYWNSGQQELAMKFLKDAKCILDASIGPNHIRSLKTSHTLSEFYGNMGRFARALEIEKKVVKGLKGLAPSELGFMHEVNKHLNEMKKRVAESSTTASSQSKDGGPPVKISESDISGDVKGT